MSDRLQKLRVVDPVLTTIAIGYKNQEYVGTRLFPVAEVPKEGGKIPKYGQEHFRVYNTLRANGADTARLRVIPGDSITYQCDEHALEVPVTDREGNEAADLQILRIRRTKRAVEAIHLGMEKRQADLARNPANYDAANVVVLAGAQQFNDSTSDPVAVIEEGKEQIRRQTGSYPNVAVMGPDVFAALKEAPALLDKFKHVIKGVLTAELLAEAFGLDQVVVGRSIFFDGAKNADIWGKDMVLAYVPASTGDSADPEVPAFGYTLRRMGYPVVDTYRDERPEAEILRYKDDYEVLVTSAIAGYLIRNAVS